MPKKISLVLGLALVLVVASVSMAYAAANSGYAGWDPNAGDNELQAEATPHKGYTTTTVKCAVCHAVHKGTNGGELLLMSTAGSSCTYCHIDDNIGLIRLYNGAAANYTGALAEAHSQNVAGASVGSRCTDCHAVHGANTMGDATVTKFILKTSAAYTLPAPGTRTYQAEAQAAMVAADKDTQIDAFCSICHPYYQTAYNGTISVGVTAAGGGLQNGTFQSHVMGNSAGDLATYGNPSATYSGQVAWVESSHCRSCHDAGVTNEQAAHLPPTLPGTLVAESFPHYTATHTRFMTSGGFRDDAGADTLSYVPSNGNDSDTLPDGACLKCHRSTGANTGVSFEF